MNIMWIDLSGKDLHCEITPYTGVAIENTSQKKEILYNTGRIFVSESGFNIYQSIFAQSLYLFRVGCGPIYERLSPPKSSTIFWMTVPASPHVTFTV